MAQVKFYSVANLPGTPDAGGVYFVDNGELYKGGQRFGLGRVTVAASTASVEGAARGDVVVTGSGAGWVYDGTAWQSIGGDIASLTSAWRSDIKTWTAGLSAGGEGSYITGITQAEDGKVTANASNFALDVKTAIGNGSASGTANGITVSVVTTSGSVTGVEVAAADLSVNSIYANDATFDATTVTASTLTVAGDEDSFTVGGSTIPDFINNAIGGLEASTVTASANGIQVGVTTQSGKVTGVSVSANAIIAQSGTFENLTVTDTATFSATTVSADTLTIGGSTVEQLADKQIAAIAASTVVSASNGITVSVTTQGGSVTAVALNAEAFGNAIHFRGVKASTGAVSDPEAGDIVVIGSEPATGFVAGQEYIYDGTKWELIGDQNTYALNAYSSTASVYAGVETLPGALNAAGAAIDALKTKTDAYVGGSASDADQGVAVTVSVDSTTLAPSVDVVVTSATLFSGLDATVTSAAKGIEVEVVEEDGKLTSASVAVTAPSEMAFNATVSADELATTAAVKSYFENNLVWLGADGNPVDGGSTPVVTNPKTVITFTDNTSSEYDITSLSDSTLQDADGEESGTPMHNADWTKYPTSITVGTKVTSIWNIFENGGGAGLQTVIIPSNVVSIVENAFNGCSNATVTFQGRTLAEVQAMANYPWGLNSNQITVA